MEFSCFSSLEAVDLPSVTIQRAEDVYGKNHSNSNLYILVSFGAETKITKGFTTVANNNNVYALWCKFDHY
ncbi:synaptotagmin-3-like [Pyrus ussuriensis x Pyrus communis]|uniref:Synaptotagmin-3-like n=1 Tax=Pyrus ussuriensis x Pyrus communis TaxID=2448454 RepID=A0A5N5H365_9ROSA|nr:synaptotagmin-3-like [Pyrus ussuriensis x Pyrus communis]